MCTHQLRSINDERIFIYMWNVLWYRLVRLFCFSHRWWLIMWNYCIMYINCMGTVVLQFSRSIEIQSYRRILFLIFYSTHLRFVVIVVILNNFICVFFFFRFHCCCQNITMTLLKTFWTPIVVYPDVKTGCKFVAAYTIVSSHISYYYRST